MVNFLEAPGLKPGFHKMPFEEYLAIPALNSSSLKQMAKTPKHFMAALGKKKTFSWGTQQAIKIGKAFDRYFLDRENFSVMIEPDLNKNTKVYKEWASNVPDGMLVLSKEDMETVKNMAESVYQKKIFKDIFGSGTSHLVMIWQDMASELWCKAEIDWISDNGILVDLKTSHDITRHIFYRTAMNLGYHNQLAFYLSGLTKITNTVHNECYIAAVEQTEPYEAIMFRPSTSTMSVASQENLERMISLRYCFERNEWPGYQDEIFCLESGSYIYTETIEEEEGDY